MQTARRSELSTSVGWKGIQMRLFFTQPDLCAVGTFGVGCLPCVTDEPGPALTEERETDLCRKLAHPLSKAVQIVLMDEVLRAIAP